MAIVALAIAMYTLQQVRKAATAASTMWDRANWAWQHIPDGQRDRIKRRVGELADQGLTTLETATPTWTY